MFRFLLNAIPNLLGTVKDSKITFELCFAAMFQILVLVCCMIRAMITTELETC